MSRPTASLFLLALCVGAQPMPQSVVDTNNYPPVTNQTVTLAWNPSTDPTVMGYDLYFWGWGQTNSVNAGNATNCQITFPLFSSTFTDLLVTATTHNSSGIQSPMSNLVTFSGWSIAVDFGYTVHISSASDLVHWAPDTLPVSYTNPPGTKFYRTSVLTTAQKRMIPNP